MAQANSLPARPDLAFLKKLAKERLRERRKSDPKAKLADAQLTVAREHGFSSWRALKAHVDALTGDAVVTELFKSIDAGDTQAVTTMLKARPGLAQARDARSRSRGTYDRVTALQLAAIGEPRFVPVLLDRFVPLDIFHAAALGDDARVAALLKQDRTLATAQNTNGW